MCVRERKQNSRTENETKQEGKGTSRRSYHVIFDPSLPCTDLLILAKMGKKKIGPAEVDFPDKIDTLDKTFGSLKKGGGFDWGLIDFVEDPKLAVNVIVFGQCIWGKLNEVALGQNCMLCCLCGGICHPCQRQALVQKYGINEPCINTWIVSYVFGSCSGCQMVHEVEKREGGKFSLGGLEFVKGGSPDTLEIER